MRTYTRIVLAVVMIVAVTTTAWAAPLDKAWLVRGEGNWKVIDETPEVIWQGASKGATSAILKSGGTGGVWRCLVEPATHPQGAGFWFGASADLARGFLVTLGGTPRVGGVVLRDAAGKVLWQDKYAPFTYYTPYLVEGIVEKGRVRVEVFAWDRKTLVAQSEWIEAPGADPAHGTFALHTDQTIARFYRWERAQAALSPIVADSPTKLRLVKGEDSEWTVIGDADWKWTTGEQKVLRQGAKVERTTAVNTAIVGAEGTWRCRVVAEKGTCGTGLLFQALAGPKSGGSLLQVDKGFVAWLGGTYGAGGLMLYRTPGKCLWSSPQEKWFYDTEYVIEGTIRDGRVSIRMLKADAATVIAESPAFALSEEEKGRAGYVGFQTWKGTARFWDFNDATRTEGAASVEAPKVAAVSSLGKAWRVSSGQWAPVGTDGKAVAQKAASGAAVAVNTTSQGAKGTYGCRVTPGKGTKSVSLLFQTAADLSTGFELRMGEGLLLRSLEGRELWDLKGFTCEAGKAYVLEGTVITDRVRVRVLDGAGKVLAASEDRYVSDTNNTRQGHLGLRTEDGPAEFTAWSITKSE